MLDIHQIFPLMDTKRLCFLKNIITHPNIKIGDYTYYDDPVDVYNFQKHILYHFDFIEDKLIIGKFCQLASKIRFIMNGANHALAGFSTYPFAIFQNEWKDLPLKTSIKGDTIIDHDVWIGYGSTIMPGIHIHSGSIIATQSVVTKDVPPYTIVGGNPAKIIRQRFDDKIVEQLLSLQWWHWSIDKIAKYGKYIITGDPMLFHIT